MVKRAVSRKNTIILIIIILLVLSSYFWTKRAQEYTYLWEARELITLRHEVGLKFRVPTDYFEVDKKIDGFVLSPRAEASFRSPTAVSVSLMSGNFDDRFRSNYLKTGRNDIFYFLSSTPGGSGGDEWTLSAAVPVAPEKWILIKESKDYEGMGNPIFELCFAIAYSIEYD